MKDNTNLTVPFLLFKIDRALALCDGNKIPDPDGFNLSLFKRFWPLFKEDIGMMFAQIHQFGTLPCSFSSFVVT